MSVAVVVAVGVWAVCGASPLDSLVHKPTNNRDARLFNLKFLPFVTVNVRPTPCQAKSDNSTGTCTTRGQCQGREDGSCANGYGVCCVVEYRCGATVKQNNTFLINNEYPDPLNNIGNCQYNIEKMNSNVCQLRLDFLSLSLAQPDEESRCETDTLTFVGSAGGNPTVACGDLTGHHMYLDLEGNGNARINIATTDDSVDRNWRIKVTQIPCSSNSRAPPGCLQYFTEYSGVIKSFNFKKVDTPANTLHLANQRYTVCVRAEEGFCGIKYTSDDFSMSNDATAAAAAATGDTSCDKDYVLIPGLAKDGSPNANDRFCGTKLDTVETYSKPFEIRVVTSDDEGTADTANQGFSIKYSQIPC